MMITYFERGQDLDIVWNVNFRKYYCGSKLMKFEFKFIIDLNLNLELSIEKVRGF
jgi:hypothetical protein